MTDTVSNEVATTIPRRRWTLLVAAIALVAAGLGVGVA